jgi:DegV family protein with EDD domain
MRIKITSDSTCDLSEALIHDNDITITPLTAIKDGKSYLDGVDIQPADIFAHVDAGGALCSTAAVNIAEYRALFETLSEDYDAIVHINIGSAFSACYQNACIAAEEFPKVRVIDSQNLSSGQGHIVMEACARAKDCTDVDQLCEELRALVPCVEASFLINRLDYMVKGGRCSSVMALGANILQLKPCIEVKNGKMQVVKKYRGPFGKCLTEYVKDRLSARDDIIRERLFITHTPVSEGDMKSTYAAVEKHGGFSRVIETDAGCTVACHCGPNTLGVLFIRKAQ